MENQNTGSFGAAIGGGGNAIAQAMARRGMGGGATSQVSPAAPTASEQLPPAPVPQAPPSSIPQQTGIGQPPSQAESSIIVRALDSRLKTLGKLQEAGMQV